MRTGKLTSSDSVLRATLVAPAVASSSESESSLSVFHFYELEQYISND